MSVGVGWSTLEAGAGACAAGAGASAGLGASPGFAAGGAPPPLQAAMNATGTAPAIMTAELSRRRRDRLRCNGSRVILIPPHRGRSLAIRCENPLECADDIPVTPVRPWRWAGARPDRAADTVTTGGGHCVDRRRS